MVGDEKLDSHKLRGPAGRLVCNRNGRSAIGEKYFYLNRL